MDVSNCLQLIVSYTKSRRTVIDGFCDDPVFRSTSPVELLGRQCRAAGRIDLSR